MSRHKWRASVLQLQSSPVRTSLALSLPIALHISLFFPSRIVGPAMLQFVRRRRSTSAPKPTKSSGNADSPAGVVTLA